MVRPCDERDKMDCEGQDLSAGQQKRNIDLWIGLDGETKGRNKLSSTLNYVQALSSEWLPLGE